MHEEEQAAEHTSAPHPLPLTKGAGSHFPALALLTFQGAGANPASSVPAHCKEEQCQAGRLRCAFCK